MMLDLFSGIGGFSIAAERCGIPTAAFCEMNPFCRRVLAKHWPEVPIFEDVTKLTADTLRARGVGRITGLSAGWPCQGNSVAGKRAGHSDERSGLFSEVVRLADELHPQWLLLENVPGLVSVNGGDDFADVIGELRRRDYVGCVRRLDAQHFGLAQRRARLLFVGGVGAAGIRAVHAVMEGGKRHSAPRREAGARVAYALADGNGNRSGSGRDGRDTFVSSRDLSPSLRAKSNDPHRADMAAYVTHTLTAEGFDASEDGTGRGPGIVPFDPRQITSSVNRSNPQAGDPCHTLHEHAAAIAFGANDDGRDATTDLCPTLRCGGLNGGGVHTAIARHSGVRKLTPTEHERLQGFSIRDQRGEWQDGWTCLCGLNRGRSHAATGEPCACADSPRYRALGNAVAVPVVEWMLRRIAESAPAPERPTSGSAAAAGAAMAGRADDGD